LSRHGKAKPKLEQIIEDLHPKQQAGISQEGDGTVLKTQPKAKDAIAHMSHKVDDRQNAAPFVADVTDDRHIFMDNLGRHYVEPKVTLSKKAVEQIQTGYRCLKCKEGLFDSPFPLLCDACGYPIKERQVVDFSLEFKGAAHIGPAIAIDEYLAEQDERVERRKFAQKLKDGIRTGGGVLIPKGIRNA
jgi:hypothetical protein